MCISLRLDRNTPEVVHTAYRVPLKCSLLSGVFTSVAYSCFTRKQCINRQECLITYEITRTELENEEKWSILLLEFEVFGM